MKIAVITNDGQTISQHFGRASHYKIFIVENNEITEQETRERKTGHNAQGQSHNHEQHDNSQGHGIGQDDKHDQMAREIGDCQILIAGGMGIGAYKRFFENGISVMMTDKSDISDAVKLYSEGKLENLYQQRTH
ncbi:MAG: NifB/NifX family molybdenum-iron cluster-binding protein [Bacteroidota bacterium]|nr:NifB/NifX family molybdenum-iron cluster-binding protein [Bacteroidota bacterium]